MRTKNFRKSRRTFRSVGIGADGHVSDMRDPSVLGVGKSIGIGADGHVSDMRKPSVLGVGKSVGIGADGHVSDMRELRDVRKVVGDSDGESVGIGRRKSRRKYVGEYGTIP